MKTLLEAAEGPGTTQAGCPAGVGECPLPCCCPPGDKQPWLTPSVPPWCLGAFGSLVRAAFTQFKVLIFLRKHVPPMGNNTTSWFGEGKHGSSQGNTMRVLIAALQLPTVISGCLSNSRCQKIKKKKNSSPVLCAMVLRSRQVCMPCVGAPMPRSGFYPLPTK